MPRQLQFGWGVPPGSNFLTPALPHTRFLEELAHHIEQISDAWREPKPEPAPPIMIGGKKPACFV